MIGTEKGKAGFSKNVTPSRLTWLQEDGHIPKSICLTQIELDWAGGEDKVDKNIRGTEEASKGDNWT